MSSTPVNRFPTATPPVSLIPVSAGTPASTKFTALPATDIDQSRYQNPANTPIRYTVSSPSLIQDARRFAAQPMLRLKTFEAPPAQPVAVTATSATETQDLSFEQRAGLFRNVSESEKTRILNKSLAGMISLATRPTITVTDLAEFEKLKNQPKTSPLLDLLDDEEILGLMCFAVTFPDEFNALWHQRDFSSQSSLINGKISPDELFQNFAGISYVLRQWYAIKFDPNSKPEQIELVNKAIGMGISTLVTYPLRQAIENIDFSQFDPIKKLHNPEYGVAGDNEIEATLRKALPAYFGNLDLQTKGRVLNALVKLPNGSSDEDAILAVIQACGPGLQKLFQLFGSRSASEHLRIKLDELKDNIIPFANEDALRIISEEIGQPLENVFLAISETPIAAASVSQVYYALIKGPNGPRPVAVKVRRPDYVERLRGDFAILKRVVKDELSMEVLEKLELAFLKEADFRIEAAGLRKGHQYQHMQAVPLVDEISPTAKIIIMDWADDATIKRAFPKLNQQERMNLNDRYAHAVGEWLERALSGDGFFHGDPHAGNLTHSRFKSLDYGNTGVLSRDVQYGFIKLAASAFLNKPEWMLGAIYTLNQNGQPLSSSKEKELQDIIRKELSGQAPILAKINVIIGHSVRLGLPLPESLVEFLRGILLFESGWNRLRDTVQKSELSLAERLHFRKNSPEAVLLLALIKKTGLSAPRGLHDFTLYLGKRYLDLVRR